MNKQALIKCALQLKARFREMHGLLDDTPEMEDSRYLMLITMMNEFRVELFANLAMIGVEIPMTEREMAPVEATAVVKKRDWAVNHQAEPKPRHWDTPMPRVVQSTKNPFAGNGFGREW